ncbi:hypothetical protein FRB97_002484 [Tulasnella sp. 331]|nr:hypothetical protein FRB97_002484 [Tulasnella sp. 331]
MENLRLLDLVDVRSNTWLPSGSFQLLKDAAQHLSLTSLHLPLFTIESAIGLQQGLRHVSAEPDILVFLRQQPRLEHLSLYDDHLEGLQPTDIPNLRSLATTASHAKIIVPGRPITTMSLLFGMEVETERLWKALAASSGPLTDVTLQSAGFPDFELHCQAMAVHLPRITSLTLKTFHIGFDDTVSESLRLLSALHPLTHLRTLRVGLASFRTDTHEVWCGLRSACPNIEQISVTRLPAVDDGWASGL